VKLVPGLKWSDGEPITADDIIFTWQAICDPEVAAASTAGFDHIKSMDRKSDLEVVWNFAPEPKGYCGSPAAITSGVYAPYLLLGPVMWLLPQHRLKAVRHADWGNDKFFVQPDVTSGPFKVAEVVPDDRITLSINPHYADGRGTAGAYSGKPKIAFTHAPYLDKVVYKVYSSKDGMIAGLKAGETDVGFHLATQDLREVSQISASSTVSYTGLEDEFLNPNHGMNQDTKQNPPWVVAGGEDLKLLDALSLAIDRDALVHDVLENAALPARGLYPRALRAFSDPSIREQRRDVEGAKKMLDEDGWKATQDGTRVKDGRRLAFTLLTICNSAQRDREVQLLTQQWKAVGAAVKSDCRKRGVFLASYRDGGTNATGAFDMTLYANTWQPDPSSWASFAVSGQVPSDATPSGQNWNRCRDPQLDQAFGAGEADLGVDQRRRAYLAAQKEWLAYHCTIPLFETPQVRQVSTKMHNFTPNPSISMDVWNAADWWINS
jgi:peptide/nickel transport system substrate-binding protein